KPTRYVKSLEVYQIICDECHTENLRRLWYPIKSLQNKLEKIGIYIEIANNVPWIYIESVNGVKIKERFHGNHGFTAFYYPVRNSRVSHFTDIKYVFTKIRQMVEGKEILPDDYEEYDNRN